MDGSQYEGGEPCSICGHVIVLQQAEKPENVIPTTVIPGFLYLGNYDSASRAELLKAMNISHILNVRCFPISRTCCFIWQIGADKLS